MSNRAGIHHGLTVLSPIVQDPDRSPPHDAELRAKLGRLSDKPPKKSPLAKVPGTHFARWVVVRDFVFEGCPAHKDHLNSQYLLFSSNFDGELEPYLDAMWRTIGDVVQHIWCHCYGFEDVTDAKSFRRYIRRCQLRTTFFFSDYPDASLGHVLEALQYQKSFIKFVEETQGQNGAILKARFEEFMVRMRRTPYPSPGTK